METALGIAAHDGLMVGVEAVRRGRRALIRNVEIEPVPEDKSVDGGGENDEESDEEREEPRVRALKTLLSRLPARTASLVLPAKHGLMREVVVPFTKADHIRRTIPFEAERLIAGGRMEDYLIDFHRLGGEEGKSRVFLTAMPVERVGAALSEATRAGCNPRVLDMDVGAAYNALLAAGYKPREEGIEAALVFCGETVLLYLHNDGELNKIRTMRSTRGDASRRASKLVRELRTTIASAGLEFTPAGLLAAGDCEEFLLAELSRKLPCPVERFSLSESLGEGLSDEKKTRLDRIGVAAAGAALRLLGQAEFKLDMRRGPFAFQKPFEQIKSGLACLVTLLFFVTLLAAYAYKFKATRDHRQVQVMRAKANRYFRELFPGERALTKARRSAVTVNEYLETFERLLEIRKTGEMEREVIGVTDILEDLVYLQSDVRGAMRLHSVQIRPEGSRLTVWFDSDKTADDMMRIMETGRTPRGRVLKQRLTDRALAPKFGQTARQLTLRPPKKKPGR